MSSDALTVLVGVIGIATSYLFYRLGVRSSDALVGQLRDRETRSFEEFTRVFERLTKEAAGRPQVEHATPRSQGSRTAQAQVSAPPETAPDLSMDILVKASLGALQDARGNVSLRRLQREVAAVVHRPAMREVTAALRRLRAQGVVDWDGSDDDLGRTGVVAVNSLPATLSSSGDAP
jgi:hypothetical protein